VDARIVFDNGTVATLTALDAERFSLFEMDIIGTRGRVRVVDSCNRLEHFWVGESDYYPGYRALRKEAEVSGDLGQALPNAVENILSCLDGKSDLLCPGSEAEKTLSLAFGLLQSARERQR